MPPSAPSNPVVLVPVPLIAALPAGSLCHAMLGCMIANMYSPRGYTARSCFLFFGVVKLTALAACLPWSALILDEVCALGAEMPSSPITDH